MDTRSLQHYEARDKGSDAGFTLIEILIVLVILGVLAAIVVFAVQDFGTSSAQSACRADYKTVETAAEAYKGQVGTYPTNVAALASKAADGQGPWIKEAPSNTHYTLSISPATGAITVTPAGSSSGTVGFAGCDAVS